MTHITLKVNDINIADIENRRTWWLRAGDCATESDQGWSREDGILEVQQGGTLCTLLRAPLIHIFDTMWGFQIMALWAPLLHAW